MIQDTKQVRLHITVYHYSIKNKIMRTISLYTSLIVQDISIYDLFVKVSSVQVETADIIKIDIDQDNSQEL